MVSSNFDSYNPSNFSKGLNTGGIILSKSLVFIWLLVLKKGK